MLTGSMLAMVMAVTTAVAWSGVDVARKRMTSVLRPVPLVVLLSLGQAPLFIAWALVSAGGGTPSLLGYLPWGLATVAINMTANLLFVRAVQVSPLSLTLPLLTLTPVFAAGLGAAFIDQVPSVAGWLGVVAVMIGCVILVRQARPEGGSIAQAFAREPGMLMMVAVACLFACSIAVDKRALDHADRAVHALVQTGGVGLLLLAYLATRDQLDELRRLKAAPRVAAAMIICANVALGAQLLAVAQVFVGVVEVIKRAVGLAVSLIAGKLVFDEDIPPGKLVAVAVLAVGAILLAFDEQISALFSLPR